MTSPRTSPSSGANAATKTSPPTFGAPFAALLITAPAYECPTASTGPGIWSITLRRYAESATMPRSGFAGAMTATPAAWSRVMTPLQLEASAKAPWTSTTSVGRDGREAMVEAPFGDRDRAGMRRPTASPRGFSAPTGTTRAAPA